VCTQHVNSFVAGNSAFLSGSPFFPPCLKPPIEGLACNLLLNTELCFSMQSKHPPHLGPNLYYPQRGETVAAF
jgi:hypothetical protein